MRNVARAQIQQFRPTVIAVTGSVGKTSTKAAIAHLIGPPDEVQATPGSFNTPLGVSRTINASSFTIPGRTELPIGPMWNTDYLNLGGVQLGVDTTRSSAGLVGDDSGRMDWRMKQQQREIALDEIVEVLGKHHGGTSNDAKKARADLIEKHAGTRSWERVKSMSFEDIFKLRNDLWIELEGSPYNFTPPTMEVLDDEDKVPGV